MVNIRKPTVSYDTIRESLDAVRGVPSIKKRTDEYPSRITPYEDRTKDTDKPRPPEMRDAHDPQPPSPPIPTSSSDAETKAEPEAETKPTSAKPVQSSGPKTLMHVRINAPKRGQFPAFDEMTKTIPVEKLIRRLLARAVTELETSVSEGKPVRERSYDQGTPSVKTTRTVSTRFYDRMKTALDPHDVETAGALANRIAVTALAGHLAAK